MSKNRVKKYLMVAGVFLACTVLASFYWPYLIIAGGYSYNSRSEAFDWIHEVTESIEWFQDEGGSVALMDLKDGMTLMTHDGYSSLLFNESKRSVNAEKMNGATLASLMPEEDRKSAVILGFGTGITIGEAAKHFDQVLTFEVREAMIDLAFQEFGESNNNVEEADNSEVVLQDGIVGLAGLKEKRSAIYVNVPSPGMRGAEKIYAAETLSLIRSKLKTEGLVFLWMHAAQGPEVIQVLSNTIESELGECRYFLLRPDYFQAICAPHIEKEAFFSRTPMNLKSYDSNGYDFGYISRVSEIRRIKNPAPELSEKRHTFDHPWFDTRALFTETLVQKYRMTDTYELVNKADYCAYFEEKSNQVSFMTFNVFCSESDYFGENL